MMRTCVILVAFLVSASAFANSADTAFAKLKALQGKWVAAAQGASAVDTLEVVSDGSAVMERFGGMITMYTVDNDSILATHYCDAHNQPRLRATSIADSANALDFDFVDVTGAKPGQGYINHLRIEFVDADHIVEKWSYGIQSTSVGTEVFNLTRAK